MVGGGGASTRSRGRASSTGTPSRSSAELGDVTVDDVDLVIPGPESVLVDGIADECHFREIPCFGPTAELARLESSKGYGRDLATSLGVPGPALRAVRGARRRRRDRVVARVRRAGRGQARRARRRQGRDRARVDDDETDRRDQVDGTARTVRARGADERPGVLAARALRRPPRGGAAARPGPQAHRRGRHRPEHRRHGRVRTGTGAPRSDRAAGHVRPADPRLLRGRRHAVRRRALRRADAHGRRPTADRVQLPLRRPRDAGRAAAARRRPGRARARRAPAATSRACRSA